MNRQLPRVLLLVVLLSGNGGGHRSYAGLIYPDSAQHPGPGPANSTSGLAGFLRRGRFYGHGRTFWMGTINRADIRDYYALAAGAGIGYHTPRMAGHVELGMNGFFMFNLLSSDLAAADPRTGRSNRYEAGLFNVLKPDDHQDLDRLEELYVRYHFGRSSRLTLGRQIPASPFVNPQDGRMRPTLTEGIVLEWQEWRNLHVRAEYLVRISPRSTVDWFSIGESVSLLPGGVTTTGQPSRYAGNIRSDGLLMLGLTQQRGRLNWQLWETYFPSVFHTAYGKVDWVQPVNRGRQWLFGGQLTRQWALGHGGNEDARLTYMEPGTRSLVLSGQAGYQTTPLDVAAQCNPHHGGRALSDAA